MMGVIEVAALTAVLTRMNSGRDPSSAGRFHSPPSTGLSSTSSSTNWSTVVVVGDMRMVRPAASGELRYCARRSAGVAASP